ncbi:hypothetical protein K41_14755, partial [Klebsiella pneumoniae]
SGANDNGIKPFHTAFLVPQLSGFVNISLWSHQREKSRIRYIIERYRITPNRVKPKQEENQKSLYFTLPAPLKSLIMRRVHVLKMA